MSKSTKTKAAEVVLDQIVEPNKMVAVHEDSSADRMLAIIDKASTDPRCNIEKMRALLDMKMELIKDDRKQAYINAMVDAQTEMTPIVTKEWNDSTKSFFAKLAHVDYIIRPIYTRHGFSLSFDSAKEADGSITMFVDVLHRNGHSERKRFNAEVDDRGPKGTPNKTKPQGAASTGTILQRKLTVMVFNLTFINQDDDGQGGKIDPNKEDRFRKDGAPAKEKLSLEDATNLLEQKLRNEPDKAKRGEILMRHVKVLGALSEAGQTDKEQELRKLAEEVANGA